MKLKTIKPLLIGSRYTFNGYFELVEVDRDDFEYLKMYDESSTVVEFSEDMQVTVYREDGPTVLPYEYMQITEKEGILIVDTQALPRQYSDYSDELFFRVLDKRVGWNTIELYEFNQYRIAGQECLILLTPEKNN